MPLHLHTRRRRGGGLVLFVVLLATAVSAAWGDPLPPIGRSKITIELEPVVSGITPPLVLATTGDHSGRMFLATQDGKIYLVKPGGPMTRPPLFLDVSPNMVKLDPGYDERGLLGLAFHPGFHDRKSPGFGKFYTYTNEPAKSSPVDFPLPPHGRGGIDSLSVVSEWTVDPKDPDRALPQRRIVFTAAHPQMNHDGGQVSFGPDGYLYIAIGDGGAARDRGNGHFPEGNGQNLTTVMGKLLRLDPLDPATTPQSKDPVSANGKYRTPADNPFDGKNGLREIYAYGLRNIWRFCFDDRPGGTGKIIAGDVGQNQIEELDDIVKGGNYGWNLKEGSFRFDPGDASVHRDTQGLPKDLIDPVAEYDHGQGPCIIGGFVYRGKAVPALRGLYVSGDLSTKLNGGGGTIFVCDLKDWQLQVVNIGATKRRLGMNLKSFGQDDAGELYVLGSSSGPTTPDGKVYRIVSLSAGTEQ